MSKNNLPVHIIVMSEEGFYLRDGSDPKDIKHIDLEGKPIALVQAKKAAIKMGYSPTHWFKTGESRVSPLVC